MRPSIWGIALAGFVSTFGFAGMANLTLDISAQTKTSDIAVIARAKTVTPRWHTNAYGDKLIVSQIQMEVEETFKGSPEKTVLVDLEGGTLDGLTLRVSDLPQIKTGDRAILFLKKDGASFKPHRRGFGILKVETNGRVEHSSLGLNEIRSKARTAGLEPN